MAKIKVNNIVRFSMGSTDHPGILDASFDVDRGTHLSNIDEGAMYPVGADNVGTGRFPVSGSVNLENVDAVADLIAAAAADLTILGKAAGSASNEMFTAANALFERASLSLSRQRDAAAAMTFLAYSDDGTTHPFSRATSADSTGPAGTKVKTNNIVSVTHDAIDTPGVLGVRIDIVRGTFMPNLDEGDLYPIGADNVGTPAPGYPVTGTINMENMQAASAIGGATDDLVIVAKAAASAANQTVTCANAVFNTNRSAMRRQADGTVDVSFFCYAASASAIPFSVTPVA